MMTNGMGLQQSTTPYALTQPKKQGVTPLGGTVAMSSGPMNSGTMDNSMGGTQTARRGAASGAPSGVTPFTATNNLIGSQISPTNSAATNQAQNWTTQAGQQYNAHTIQPFQNVAPLDYGVERGMLGGANTQMQGTSYNWNPANSQYGQAQSQLAGAAAGAGGYMSQAAQLAAGGTGGGSGYSESADVKRARDLTMQNLENAQGPDRAKLAAESLALMEERSQPGYEQSLRSVNQKSAAMGRRGSGVTTNELGDVTLGRERELALARRDLANSAAGETLNDRLSVLGASQNVAQGFGSMDQGSAQINDTAARASSANSLQAASLMRGLGQDQYGMGADQANLSMGIGDRYGDQARDNTGLTERQAGFTRGIANDSAGLTRDEYGARVNERDTARADEYNQGDYLGQRMDRNAGYLGQREGQDRANRNELRDERGYQYGLSRDAVDDEFRTQGWEEELRNGRFNRGMGYADIGFGADSPAGAYENAAGQAGQRSAEGYGLLGAGLSYAGQQRRRTGAGTGG